jgi:hypothetical protein
MAGQEVWLIEDFAKRIVRAAGNDDIGATA